MEATCAVCGTKKSLCESARVDGIKQPRICKNCLINDLEIGNNTINDLFWIRQLVEFGDFESLNLLREES